MDWQSCDRCKNESKNMKEEPCYGCGINANGYEPKTNADRIRNMTDEELADFLEDVRRFGFKNLCCDDDLCDSDACDCCVHEWLQAEVEEGENDG